MTLPPSRGFDQDAINKGPIFGILPFDLETNTTPESDAVHTPNTERFAIYAGTTVATVIARYPVPAGTP
jgi:hypothetical protein